MGSHRDLPNPDIKLRSPALQADFLPSEPPGKPRYGINLVKHKDKYNYFTCIFLKYKPDDYCKFAYVCKFIFK